MSSKIEQRKLLQRKRANFDKDEATKASAEICEKIYTNIDWSTISTVHAYLAIDKNNEVSTWPLIKKLWREQQALQISTSVYGESRALTHVIITPKTEFKEDGIGVPLPISNFTQSIVKYDLIIVPVLGFDEKLNRIGYGRGVYDTFLAEQKQAKKIGLAYEIQKVEKIKNERHDIKLNEIITEAELYD